MLLVKGDYVWTGIELIADGTVLCEGDVIKDVGPWSVLRDKYEGTPVIDAPVVGGRGNVVLPGFINAHHHGDGVTSFARGVEDDNLEPWLAALGAAPSVDPYLDTMWAAIDTMEAGYTTMVLFQSSSDGMGDPDVSHDHAAARIKACRDVGLRVAFGLAVSQKNFDVYSASPAAERDRPVGSAPSARPRRGLTTEAYITLLDRLRAEFSDDAGVQVFAAPSGPEWVTDETWEAVGAWSREHDVPMHTHFLESPLQAEYARRHYDGAMLAHLDQLGALHERTALVHGVYLTEDDFRLMARRGAALITNPGSNLRLRCGVSPVLTALDHGVTVALGTDGCSLGDRDDAFGEMRLLFYLQRRAGIDTPALTWQQATATATTGAAAVTPWRDEIGAIKVGALADLVVFDLDEAGGPWFNPELHPVHVLLHRATRQHLTASIIGGRLVWERARGPIVGDKRDSAARLRACMEGPGVKPASADVEGTDRKENIAERVRAYYRTW